MNVELIKDELKTAIETVSGLDSRLSAIEAKGKRPSYEIDRDTTGSRVLSADGMQDFRDQKIDRVRVTLERKALTGTTEYETDTTLVRPDRWPGIIDPAQRVFRLRDLIPSSQTTSNLIEYTRESSVSDNAQIQDLEGDQKGETSFTFEL